VELGSIIYIIYLSIYFICMGGGLVLLVGSRLQDLGTDEFTSVSKWNDIVVNLGATKSSNASRLFPSAGRQGQDKANSMHDERARARGSHAGQRLSEGESDSWRNNKGKQQQIACPSA